MARKRHKGEGCRQLRQVEGDGAGAPWPRRAGERVTEVPTPLALGVGG